MGGPAKTAEEIMGEIQKLCQMIDQSQEPNAPLDKFKEYLSGPIAEQQKAQEALRRREIEYKRSQKVGQVGSFTVDLESGEQEWSEQIYRMLGVETGAVPSTFESFMNFVHTEDRARLDRESQRTFDEGEDLDIEYRVMRKDGRLRHVHTAAEIEYDENGTPRTIYGFSQDITERKRAEEALRREKDRAQKYLDVAAVMMVVLNAEGRVELINKKGCEILGYEEDEILGRDWFGDFLPEHLNEQVRTVFNQLMEGDAELVEYFENSVLTKDGRERIIAWHNTLLRNDSGDIIGTLSSGEDITERKKAAEALAASETKYRSLFDNSIEGIGLSKGNRVISANKALLNIFGYDSIDEFAKIPLLDHVAPESRQMIRDLMQEREKGVSDSSIVEYRIIRKDGAVRDLEISRSAISIEGENYTHSTFRDITERKQTEEALRQKEETIRVLVETSRDMIWEIDLKGIHTFCNPAIEEILGWSLAEFVGRPSLEFMHEEDRQMVEEKLPDWIAQKSGWRNIIIRWRHKDGSYRFLESNSVPIINVQGKLVGFRGVDRDITERKQAEEALASERLLSDEYIDSLPGLFYVFDEQRFVRWNSKWNVITGYSDEELAGKYGTDFFEGEDKALIAQRMQKVFREGAAEAEAELITKDGRPIPYYFSGLRKKLDGKDHLVGLGIDITKRKQAEKELKRHQAELAHMWRVNTMGEMASGLAHELNQPLCAIANYANASKRILESREDESKELVDTLGEISSQADRAGQIIRRLRTLVAKREPRQSTVHINDIVEEVLAMEKAEAIDQNITIEKNLSDDLPEIVVDPIQIEQVMLNIVRNAFDAMAKAEPETRRVSVRTSAGKDGSIEVAVSDTGMGFVSDIEEKIFDPFFTTKTKGLGVGLSLSKSIIEAHGGKLRAESNKDGGATFRFTLPVRGQDKSAGGKKA